MTLATRRARPPLVDRLALHHVQHDAGPDAPTSTHVAPVAVHFRVTEVPDTAGAAHTQSHAPVFV
ncbi:MAG: hypothetical protein WCJ30_16455 [Deltaproteobacteria bacterium]